MIKSSLVVLSLYLLPLPAPEDFTLLDVHPSPSGAVFSVAVRGQDEVVVRIRRGEERSTLERDLDLPSGARVVDARVRPFDVRGDEDAVTLGLVISRGERTTYHYMQIWEDRQVRSDPIFESEGTPFRILDLHPGDGARMTFRRGALGYDGSTADLEELVYADRCAQTTFLPPAGKSVLVDIMRQETVPLGSLVRAR